MIRALTICLCLTACGSGGGNDSGDGVNRLDTFEALRDDVVNAGVTPVELRPTTGSYDFAGLIRLDLPLGDVAPATYIGDLTLTLAFDTGLTPVAGSVTNLSTGTGDDLGGTLFIDAGGLTPDADPGTAFLFRADMDGDVSADGVTYSVDATVTGDLYGVAGDGIAGLVFGDIAADAWEGAFDGSFAAEILP